MPSVHPEVLKLAEHLHAELYPAWEQLRLPARWTPLDPRAEAGGDWQAASVPLSLRERRAELIVAASDAGAIERGIHAGADALVLDLDDVFSPRGGNLERAYAHFQHFAGVPQPFLTRVRPLAHREPRVQVGGRPAVAGLLDLAAYAWAFREREVVVYLPKLDALPEARCWKRALDLTAAWLGLPAGRLRVCLQIETLPGLMNAEGLLHMLREYAYGLNAGRWDYVFSVVKHLGERLEAPLPERARLTMNEPSMLAYAHQIVAVCRRHHAEAIGGTAAVALSGDQEADRRALEGVRLDKEREAAQGFVAAWAGSPDLLDTVRQAFGSAQPTHEPSTADHRNEALALPAAGGIPEAAVRDAIAVALAVLEAWLRGVGDVARAGRSEDTATAELARAQLWHWRRRGLLTEADYRQWRRDEYPNESPAARLLDRLVLAEACAPYFPELAEAMFPEAGTIDP